MRNLDENGIYGQFNHSIEMVKDVILNNRDLVKFLYYRDISFDIRDSKNFFYSQKIKEEVKNNQILDYNSLESKEANSYVIIETGTVTREKKGDRIDSDFITWTALVYLCCHEKISQTKNGDRIRCMEQCIQDSFSDADIVKSFNTYIGTSQPIAVADGYKCRVVPIKMSYFNVSRNVNK